MSDTIYRQRESGIKISRHRIRTDRKITRVEVEKGEKKERYGQQFDRGKRDKSDFPIV